MCRKKWGEIFLETNLVQQVIEIDKRNKESIKDAQEKLFKEKFDLLISPHESVRTALFVWRIKANNKIGFKKWWNLFVFNKTIKRDLSLPDAIRQVSLLSLIDNNLQNKILDYKKHLSQYPHELKNLDRFPIPDWASMNLSNELNKVSKKIDTKPNTVFIAPGSVWPTKRWQPAGYREVAIQLIKSGFNIVFVGSAEERELCEFLQKEIPESTEIAGRTTILELVLHFQKGQFLICNDSGAMHVASLVNLPTISIFGPTVLKQGYEPWQDHSLVVQKELSCRPCGKHGHINCPIGTHECMKAITANEVLAKISELT